MINHDNKKNLKVNPVALMTMRKRCHTNLVCTDDRMTSSNLANLVLWRASITRGGGASDVACAAAAGRDRLLGSGGRGGGVGKVDLLHLGDGFRVVGVYGERIVHNHASRDLNE